MDEFTKEDYECLKGCCVMAIKSNGSDEQTMDYLFILKGKILRKIASYSKPKDLTK